MTYSPLLAIITGVLEFAVAIWVFSGLGRGRKRILAPTGLIFLLLAGYQFAEVAVCAGPEVKIFSQLAYFDITWLPPIGLWLLSQINRPKMRWLRLAAFIDIAAAAGLSIWILTSPHIITRSVCYTVISRFYLSFHFDFIYGVFYQSSLTLLIFASAAGMASTDDPVLRKHWANFQVGILAFVLPALYVRILTDEPFGILPSVMCHFALLLAISLFFIVLRERRTPQAHEENGRSGPGPLAL